MQIHNLSNVAAATANVPKPAAAGKAAGEANTAQPPQGDRVTLSSAAKQMVNGNSLDAQAESVKQAETAINSGNYAVLGTALAGKLIVVLVE